MTSHKFMRSNGTSVDATFAVEPMGERLCVIVESRGGTRGTPSARNVDYQEGMVLLLTHLRDRNVKILDATIESRDTRHLAIEDRRLLLEDLAFPITIEDPTELQRQFGRAQSTIARTPGAKKSGGNSTRRVRFVLDVEPIGAASLAASLAGSAPVTSTKLGRPYKNIGKLPASDSRRPFEVDPDKIDRGTQAHATTQDALADFLRAAHLSPRAPSTEDPDFDLAWEHDGNTFVAEVKSITDANEEKQLRLGLGQVLFYQHKLAERGAPVVAVLVPERAPRDETWSALAAALGVLLVWPGGFETLVDD